MNTAPRAARLISLILPLGRGHALLEALDHDKGLVTAFSHHARGFGVSGYLMRRGFALQTEKDVVHVAVPEEPAEEIYEFLYHAGNIGQPHGGFMFIEPLERLHHAPAAANRSAAAAT